MMQDKFGKTIKAGDHVYIGTGVHALRSGIILRTHDGFTVDFVTVHFFGFNGELLEGRDCADMIRASHCQRTLAKEPQQTIKA